jgi:beta-N-acetylhexosaminidase
MDLDEQVGQLLMVGTDSGGLSSATAEVLATTRAGSVILLGNSTAGRAATKQVVDDVRDATRRPEGVRTLLAVDQEGGLVQRLQGPGFADIPSATRQASLSDARLTADAARWGRELKAAGITANLAPVADVVPADLVNRNQPIGRLDRGYGSSPRIVAAKATAFVKGMDQAGVATAAKHFPGLGRVIGNTDYARRVVDNQTTRRDPALAPFAATVEVGVDMVMVSSAFYTRIDPDHRAADSPVIIGEMLRGDLGFAGVVISDDLAAAAMEDLSPAERALRFVGAGGDLLIIGDPRLAESMAAALSRRAAANDAFAERVRQSATRVASLKARRGLASCAAAR